MKYTKEARFCTGCVLLTDQDGVPLVDEQGNFLGRVLPMLDYTYKTVVTYKDYMKAFADVFKAPKFLCDSKAGIWVVSAREKGQIFMGDDISLLEGLGPKTKRCAKLKSMGITTIGALVEYFRNSVIRRKNFTKSCNNMSMEKWLAIENTASQAIVGDCPPDKDHRKANNPYLSLYGVPFWRQKVLETPTMKVLLCIRDLVEHIYKETKAHFVGTVYEDNWFFYHDTLSLMTADETVQWMKDMGYYKHWILPENDLNTHIPYFKKVRPVGCHAGANSWDATLNKDHDDIVYRHVAATCLLFKDDEKKFSFATPDKIRSAYKRTYEGIPATRIGCDLVKTSEYWVQVMQNQGLNINRHIPGHRNSKGRDPNKPRNHGGPRKKKEKEEDKWYHKDALESMKELFKECNDTFFKVLKEVQTKKSVSAGEPDACMDPDGVVREGDEDSSTIIYLPNGKSVEKSNESTTAAC